MHIIMLTGASKIMYDMWNGMIYSQAFPELFSFAKNQLISVSVAATSPLLHDLFHLPLSPEAYDQYMVLTNTFQNLSL